MATQAHHHHEHHGTDLADAAEKALVAAGEQWTDMRADIFAVAIHAGMTTDELGMVDLAYAPPFSGVWDAVHIAANAAK